MQKRKFYEACSLSLSADDVCFTLLSLPLKKLVFNFLSLDCMDLIIWRPGNENLASRLFLVIPGIFDFHHNHPTYNLQLPSEGPSFLPGLPGTRSLDHLFQHHNLWYYNVQTERASTSALRWQGSWAWRHSSAPPCVWYFDSRRIDLDVWIFRHKLNEIGLHLPVRGT